MLLKFLKSDRLNIFDIGAYCEGKETIRYIFFLLLQYFLFEPLQKSRNLYSKTLK
jgi:hypothetical protein